MASRSIKKKENGLKSQAFHKSPWAIEKSACVMPHPGQGIWVINSKGQKTGKRPMTLFAEMADPYRKRASAKNPPRVRKDIFLGIRYFSIYLPKTLLISSCWIASATMFKPKIASPTLNRWRLLDTGRSSLRCASIIDCPKMYS
jgi:hypothetical protein